jgi:hypothetical protein
MNTNRRKLVASALGAAVASAAARARFFLQAGHIYELVIGPPVPQSQFWIAPITRENGSGLQHSHFYFYRPSRAWDGQRGEPCRKR